MSFRLKNMRTCIMGKPENSRHFKIIAALSYHAICVAHVIYHLSQVSLLEGPYAIILEIRLQLLQGSHFFSNLRGIRKKIHSFMIFLPIVNP